MFTRILEVQTRAAKGTGSVLKTPLRREFSVASRCLSPLQRTTCGSRRKRGQALSIWTVSHVHAVDFRSEPVPFFDSRFHFKFGPFHLDVEFQNEVTAEGHAGRLETRKCR